MTLTENPSNTNVISTTPTIPISMKNCTQQEPSTQMGSSSKAPCLDADYYDEDDDDLGDRLGQNAVLSLLGILLFDVKFLLWNNLFVFLTG